MEKLKIIKLFKDSKLPVKATKGSAGYDVYAHNFKQYYQNHGTNFERVFEGDRLKELFIKDNSIDLGRNERVLIGTGIKANIGPEYEIQVRSRSGLALKNGLNVLNSPGTIDYDYVDEVCVIMINNSSQTQNIKLGERIAQLVPKKVETLEVEEVGGFDVIDRGGGLGSTGTT